MTSDDLASTPRRSHERQRRGRVGRSSLRRGVAVVVAVLLVVAVLIEVFSLRAYVAAGRVQDTRTRHLIPALAAANSLMQAAIDQETGIRGYVITADPVFLEPYAEGRQQEADALAELDAALRDRYPELRALVDPVAFGLVRWRDSVADSEVALVDEGRLEAAADLVATGRGRLIFDAVRDDLDALTAAIEAERAATRDELVRRTDQRQLSSRYSRRPRPSPPSAAVFLDRPPSGHRTSRSVGARSDVVVARRPRHADRSSAAPAEIRTVSDAVERMRLQVPRRGSARHSPPAVWCRRRGRAGPPRRRTARRSRCRCLRPSVSSRACCVSGRNNRRCSVDRRRSSRCSLGCAP
ncbi:MAG: CHASE3 domain-containing protein [Ilumatobacteraceae bacterium]